MKIEIIVAMTPNRVIGNNGTLPWRIKEDMQLFKEITMDVDGSSVLMGRNTYESIPEKFRPLPGRLNIVVSKKLPPEPNIIICSSLDEAIDRAIDYQKPIFVIGGVSMYQEALPKASILHISHIKKEYDGGTYFPKINLNEEAHEWAFNAERDFADFTYRRYNRR